MPANQPAAISGFNDDIGAARKAVKIVNGCPKAMAVPTADKLPFHRIQLTVCCQPADGLLKKVYAMMDMIKIGIAQAIILGAFDLGGRVLSRFKSCVFLISLVIPGTCAAPRTAETFLPGAVLIFSERYWSRSSINGFFSRGKCSVNSSSILSSISLDLSFSSSSSEIVSRLKMLPKTCIKSIALPLKPMFPQIREKVT